MIFGLSTSSFTLVHVVLSLIGIASGLIVVFGMARSNRREGWTALFLATTALTSVTGFFFHTAKILPSHIVGVISLVVLALAIAGFYVFHLAGAWRWVYVVGAVTALYLDSFVAVVQAFLKVPSLHALAPKGSEPPLAVAQLGLLALFVAFGAVAVRRFHPKTRASALAMASVPTATG
jgi:hypothetical protein